MKKLLLILAGIIPSLTISAQCLYIYQGDVATVVNASTAGEMTYTSTALTANGVTFPIAEIDSIVAKNEEISSDSISVVYSANSAKVYVPVQLSPYTTVTTDGGHVSIINIPNAGDTTEVRYALTGTATDGSFYLNGSYKCKVYLNGVTLTSSKGAAIDIDNGKRIDIYAVDGTTNSFTDCANGTQKACFRVKGHAELKGSGTINIAANTKHGYKSNEYTILKNGFGTLNVTAAKSDGMHISQYFQMDGGTVNIGSGVLGDGIQADSTNNATDELNAQIILNNGNINITIANDTVSGLKCDNDFTATGGTYIITMPGKGAKAVNINGNATLSDANGAPTFTLSTTGARLTVGTDRKRSTCFKVDNNMYFYAGTVNTTVSSDRGRGIDVGNNFYYTSKAVYNGSANVDGSMIRLSE